MSSSREIRKGLGSLVLLAMTGAGLLAADVEWKSYTSEGGRFSAKFPGEVKVEDKPNAIHTHASPPGVDADFRIAYTDRDEADANADAAFKELDRIRQKTCEMQGIEAKGVSNFLYGNRPSTVFNFTKDVGDTKATYRMWFIMDGKRFYQVLYGYAVDKPLQAEGEYFYKSFKINAR
jgi:hypothetical protein